MEKKLYFQNLDASRFYAFIIVFLAHCFVTTEPGVKNGDLFNDIYNWGKLGILGLEYFFVLSSFLISYIILEEKAQTRMFNLTNFLMRRSLRVWPLYFLIVSIGFLVIFLADFTGISISPLPPIQYLMFFLVNFYIIDHGTEFLFFIAFLWSISVEEQFYLLWSIIMKWTKVNFNYFCLSLIAISVGFRYYYRNDDPTLFFHTASALANFGLGGLLAYWMHRKNSMIEKISKWNKSFVAIIYVGFFLSVFYYHDLMTNTLFRILERFYFSIFFIYIILEQTKGQHRIFNLGAIKAFSYFGKISYGLYCFHGIVITLLLQFLSRFQIYQNEFITLLVFPLIIFLTTVLVSHLSYRYFESKFLKLKDKFYTFSP